VDQAIAKHLAALGDAGLIERAPGGGGREVRYRLRPGALQPASAWLDETAAAWDARLARLKSAVVARSGERKRPPARDVTA